ncbi:MAG: SIS domain-containing protein, partial [Paralcaligenes sp.]
MLTKIEHQLPALSGAERKVAQYILEQPDEVVKLAVGDMAQRAQVSQPTVIRYCRSMGYRGWPDFKLKLAASIMGGMPYAHSALRVGDPTSVLAAKVFDNAITALLRARNDISADRIDAAIALLAAARRIEFFGLGNSGIVAVDAQHKFFRYDLAAVAYCDTHVQLKAASLLGPKDVLVAISHSGRSTDLLEAISLARKNKCPVIAITASNTPLAAQASVFLRADTPEDTDLYSPMLSRLVHLAMIDLLALGVAFAHGGSVSGMLA